MICKSDPVTGSRLHCNMLAIKSEKNIKNQIMVHISPSNFGLKKQKKIGTPFQNIVVHFSYVDFWMTYGAP